MKDDSTNSYANTIAGLLRRRSELLGELEKIRESVAATANAIDCIDRVLAGFGYDVDAEMRPSGTRKLLADPHGISRYVQNAIREGRSGFTSRDIATEVIIADGLDPLDKKLIEDMICRVGNSLRTLRKHGVVNSQRDAMHVMRWSPTGK